MTDKTAPRVTIIHHPDVRRMLMLQKAYAEGMRALLLYAATQQDAVMQAQHEGRTDDAAERLNDLLLPLVKGLGSERSYELLSQSLQIFGGSGYLQDYPIEQYIRDAKIDTLYEGTTSIQGLDLFFRKIVRDKGSALTALLGAIGEFAGSEDGNGRLKEERALLTTALGDVQAMVGAMVGFLTSAQEDVRNVYKVGQNTTACCCRWATWWSAGCCCGRPRSRWRRWTTGPRRRGTARSTRARWRRPGSSRPPCCRELTARRLIAERTDNALMDLPEESF